MPRQPRLNLPGLYYHVIVRGIERRNIFRTSTDRFNFLQRLGEGLARTGCRCFAWALMTNHLHLLLLSGVRGIVSLMHPLLTGYAVTFNAKYQRVGHLFQNRYKAILCEEDPYFLELVRYIALQPVRAGLVKTPDELALYPWTSHRTLLGGTTQPWLDVDDVLGRFGSTRPSALDAYGRFIQDGWNQGQRKDLEGGGLLRSVGGIAGALKLRLSGEPQMSDVRVLGSGSFVESVLRQADALNQDRQDVARGRSLQDLQDDIAAFAHIESSALTSKDRRRPVASTRAMLVYAAKEWWGVTGKALEDWLGISSGSISKCYARGRRLVQDGRLLDYLKRKKGSNVP